ARLAANVDEGPAADLAAQYRLGDLGRFGEAEFRNRALKLGQIEIAGKTRVSHHAHRVGRVDGVDPREGDVAQDEREHRGGQVHTLGEAAGGDHAAILRLR